MKYVLFAIVLFLTVFSDAEAKPKCWPKPASALSGSASYYKTGEMQDGVRWIAWTCTQRGVVTLYDYAAVPEYSIAYPDVTGMTLIQAAEAFWRVNTSKELTPSEKQRITPARAAASAAFGLQ